MKKLSQAQAKISIFLKSRLTSILARKQLWVHRFL
jgi:hypothetical protein